METSVRICRTYQGAEIASDHSLVMEALEIEEVRRAYEEHIKQGIRENEMTQEIEPN